MIRSLGIIVFVSLIGCHAFSTSLKKVDASSATSLSLKTQLQDSSLILPEMNKNWVVFDSITTKNFSESFKQKLALELYKQLGGILENKVSETEFEFKLEIGAPTYQLSNNNKPITKPFELTTKDNFVYASVNLTTLFAKSYYLTIAWSSSDFLEPSNIHKSDVSVKRVDFFWCNDFPKEEIISNLSPIKLKKKEETGYKYDVAYYLKVFPDVTILFEFDKKPTKAILEEVKTEVKKFGDKFKTVFIHNLVEYKGHYCIAINHNTIDFDNYTDKDFEKNVNNLDFLLESINNNSRIQGLNQIKFH